ncbi:hypothetical protein PG997_013558 [Apiospora hydei]|uniref:Uncharacterized protein n=1 Tax=Apiospora hydei TaxID=1337664 RepID=A0ABR1V6I3_9PEZI
MYKQQYHRPGLPVGVAAGVGIFALGAATIVDLLRRRAHRPVRHALRLVAVAPVAALAAVPLLLDHLLLRPDDVAAAVVPGALRRVRRRVALGLLVRRRDAQPQREALDREPYVRADRRRPVLARLRPRQTRDGTVPARGAVLFSRREFPRVLLRCGAHEVVVPPALADAATLPGVQGLVGLHVGARAVGVGAAVVGLGVVAVLDVAAGLVRVRFGGGGGGGDGQGHQEDGVEGVGQHVGERVC